MTFLESVTTCFRNYIVFSGRAARAEFWWFFVFCVFGLMLAVALHNAVLGLSVEVREGATILAGGTTQPFRETHYIYNGGLFESIFSWIVLCPFLAVGWRRLHDINKPGWLLLIPLAFFCLTLGLTLLEQPSLFSLLPGIAILVSLGFVLGMLAQKSIPGPNDHGPNPHEVTS